MKFQHLYVHVPFCARRCVYCDFSIAVRSRAPVDEYLSALESELARHRDADLDLATLYLGGGTPSKLGGDGVARVIDLLRVCARLQPDAEITIEANPEDVTPDAVRRWRDAGINRVSLGVQSFADPVLVWMHRTHDARTALSAVQVLREEGIRNISIDLIFALPVQVPRDWSRDLEMAIELEPSHVSAYGLTVEERAPLGRLVARRAATTASEDAYEREFLLADAMLRAAGWEHYEVSNYARQGQRSRHNVAYWHREPYVGLGPSAHEFDGAHRRWNEEAYTVWARRSRRCDDPLGGAEVLTWDQEEAERVYLGMRTSDGVAIREEELGHVDRWIDAGWARLDSSMRLRLTPVGWLRLDSLAAALTHVRSRC